MDWLTDKWVDSIIAGQVSPSETDRTETLMKNYTTLTKTCGPSLLTLESAMCCLTTRPLLKTSSGRHRRSSASVNMNLDGVAVVVFNILCSVHSLYGGIVPETSG